MYKKSQADKNFKNAYLRFFTRETKRKRNQKSRLNGILIHRRLIPKNNNVNYIFLFCGMEGTTKSQSYLYKKHERPPTPFRKGKMGHS